MITDVKLTANGTLEVTEFDDSGVPPKSIIVTYGVVNGKIAVIDSHIENLLDAYAPVDDEFVAYTHPQPTSMAVYDLLAHNGINADYGGDYYEPTEFADSTEVEDEIELLDVKYIHGQKVAIYNSFSDMLRVETIKSKNGCSRYSYFLTTDTNSHYRLSSKNSNGDVFFDMVDFSSK